MNSRTYGYCLTLFAAVTAVEPKALATWIDAAVSASDRAVIHLARGSVGVLSHAIQPTICYIFLSSTKGVRDTERLLKLRNQIVLIGAIRAGFVEPLEFRRPLGGYS